MRLAEVESKFANIIWENAPIKSRELAQICEKELGWKRTTTYTVLKKMCQKGIFENNQGIVEVVISRNDFEGIQGEEFVEEVFNGSLPAFIAAFTKRKDLSQKDIDEIKRMISKAKE